MTALFLTAWRYRHFVVSGVRSEFRSRFVRSRLGGFWAILQPLAQAIIFAVVLAEVLGARMANVDNKAAYAIYLLSGMSAWGLFSEIVNRCLTVFIDYAGSLKKIAFPRICLPLIVWGSALINHLLLLCVIVLVFGFCGHFPGWAWLAVPLGIALISLFAFGLGVLLGILNTFSRDVGQVVVVVMQIWFWLTPIVYTPDTPPKPLQWLLGANPLAPLVAIYQDALLHDRWPALAPLIVPVAIGATLFVLSIVLFRRGSKDLVDAL